MPWPRSTDYVEAVQNLSRSLKDKELRSGEATLNQLGLPMVWSGGVADVYKIHNASTGNTWALKCFTKRIEGQGERYRHISAHLDKKRLPFLVDFRYLEEGICIRGEWYPAVKMRWVEGGIRLNEFVEQYLNRPRTLKELLRIWVKMSRRLRQAAIGHCDLQHGNVLMVPQDGGSLALRLIDYDGVHVPSLAGTGSPELGHPSFQHPQRSRDRIYSARVDRFSHLAIYTAIHCLTVGREPLWKRFNNAENLLFRKEDFQNPERSEVFRTLWKLPDHDSRVLVGHLALASRNPLDRTPRLDEIVDEHVVPLNRAAKETVESILGRGATFVSSKTVKKAREPVSLPEQSRRSEELMEEDVTSWLGPSRAAEMPVEPLTEEELASVWQSLPAKPQSGQGSGAKETSQPVPDSEVQDEIQSEAIEELVARPEFTNVVGMQFRLIPAGEFMMGSPEDDPDKGHPETPQHRVRISNAFWLCACEVTQEQYEAVVGKNPSRFIGPTRPVEQVSWQEAQAFCALLCAMDPGRDYRLPTEAEWEYACRAGTTTRYSCGDVLDPQFAWFGDNSKNETHPVGQKRPNPWGLYDMHGNVMEWCEDWYGCDYNARPALSVDPVGANDGRSRVRRGGDWRRAARVCRSSDRGSNMPGCRFDYLGFRVAFASTASAVVSDKARISAEPTPKPTGVQKDLENHLGMLFRLIPAGEFVMGSPENDQDRFPNEIPQHRVRITQPFYLGVYEVTQEHYEQVMGTNSSRFKGPSHPVEQVSWNDATAFCAKLSSMDTRFEYRLPTEAEWEYACRAGTTTRYGCGDTLDPDFAWCDENSDGETHPVGEKRANSWGLYDMHGNVSEWCRDWYGNYPANTPLRIDPSGPGSGSLRVRRGGSWHDPARGCRSAVRSRSAVEIRFDTAGFRVVMVLKA